MPSTLFDELMYEIKVKSETDAVITAIRDEIRIRKQERIKTMAGDMEFTMSADRMKTGALDKILVDTSAWIEFFRKKEPWHSAISGLMEDKRICCSGIILAELMLGAKSEKELEVLRDFRHVFEFLEESVDLWQAAGELSNTLQRKGKSVGFSDW
jgi:predicted nucleic acid-binding protein